jgi:hypothetical protein
MVCRRFLWVGGWPLFGWARPGNGLAFDYAVTIELTAGPALERRLRRMLETVLVIA